MLAGAAARILGWGCTTGIKPLTSGLWHCTAQLTSQDAQRTKHCEHHVHAITA
jgi:hypothetical protein